VAHDEMLELARRGHRITAISVWGGPRDKAADLAFDVIHLKNRVQIINILNLLLKYPVKIIKHFILLKKYIGIQDTLKFLSSYIIFTTLHPDRIHAHFANNAALKGYLFSKFLEVPFSCTGHGSEILLYPEPYLRELILNSRPFITISNYNKKILVDRYQIPDDKIQVNYCGVNIEYFTRDTTTFPEIFTIVSITALKQIKGVHTLLEACRLLKMRSIRFNCRIIGDGEDKAKLKRFINENNLNSLNSQVLLIGAVDPEKIKNELQHSSVFVLSSLSEGIPIAVMEAMAMKLPVIATDITGLPEIIENGKNGYLVPSADSQAITDKIIELYHNPGLRTELGKEARKTVENKFNLKTNVGRFEELINRYV